MRIYGTSLEMTQLRSSASLEKNTSFTNDHVLQVNQERKWFMVGKYLLFADSFDELQPNKDIWKNYVSAWSILTHYSIKSFWQTALSPFSNL